MFSRKTTIGGLVLWTLIGVLASGCQPRNEYVAPPPPKVTVAIPLTRPIVEYFETTGRTRAVAFIELRARVGGYLQQIHFKDGDPVKAGDLLFTIDKAPYEVVVASAEAQVAKALAQLQLAEQQLARTRALAANNAATESSLDIQLAEKASREAEVAAAEAALREAKLNLSYTEIRAPFDGRIGRHQVDVGNLVIEGQTVLSSLESTDPIHAYFELSESDLLRFMDMIREGTLKFDPENPPEVEVALGNSGDFVAHGKLDYLAFGVDPGTGTTERRAVFPNPSGMLIPGLFVRVRAALGDAKPRLMVEDRAISSDQRGEYLLVVGNKNVVEQRRVTTGLKTNGLRVISSGLQPRDRVVINGLQKARPGSTVDPEQAEMGSSLPPEGTKVPASAPENKSSPDLASPAPPETSPDQETPGQ